MVRRLGAVAAGGLEATELALGLLAGLVRERRLRDAGAVALDLVLAVGGVAELLADGVHLAPQDELALRLLQAVGHVVADAAAQLDLAQGLRAQARAFSSRATTSMRLEQLELALERQVRRVAGGVGQGAGLVDGAQERGHARVAAGLEDLLDHGPVLVGQLLRPLGGGHLGPAARRPRCAGTAPRHRPGRARHGAGHGWSRRGRRPAAWPGGRRARRPRRHGRTGRSGAEPGRPGRARQSDRASSTAARASSVASATASAMFGRTTPSSSGISGSVRSGISSSLCRHEGG